MLQTSHIISNKSFNIEEYETVKFDCLIEQHILAAWRISLRHDNIYRYYYTNSNFRHKFLQQNEHEDKSSDVMFENNMRTMIFFNVRQWINSAFENIQCVIYNNKTNIFEIMIFYLNIYVSPFSFSLNINDISMKDQSIFWFYDTQHINIVCEIYSYPKSILQFYLNHQIIHSNEIIDCLYDDLSTVLLSNSLCLLQTHWRIRVRINTTIYLSKENNEQNFTCSIINFPYGNTWKYSTCIQFIEIEKKTTKLSTSFISSFKYSRIIETPLIDSTFVTLSTTQTIIFKKSDKFLQGSRYQSISFIFIFVITLSIILTYLIYKSKRIKVFNITSIQ
ncbi:unnamed protein product [Rotaria sordida]|uniref:Uncharacterized protein n=1 Tax=Rotaria sordida TaxID=392033 RepID=A0A814H8T7_9BILA|nr:unnamed protein product [Rotaria sordida]CAF1192925.1 unnamed protein product [Rotaria sordida]